MRPLGHIRRGTLTFPVRRCTNFNQVSVVHWGVPKWMDIWAFVLRMKFCLPGARALEDMVVLTSSKSPTHLPLRRYIARQE